MNLAQDNYSPSPNHNEHGKVELEEFIAVKDEASAEADTAQLDDPEKNNLNKVKAIEDDNEDEKDESLPVVENPDLVDKAKLKIAGTQCDLVLSLGKLALY